MSGNRYSYANFTGKPYIYYFGVPYRPGTVKQNNAQRTIIRTNQPAMSAIPQDITDSSGTWANAVRKDNLFRTYANSKANTGCLVEKCCGNSTK